MPLPKIPSGYRIVFRDYKRNAFRRGLKFQLTLVEFITIVSMNCHYCGEKPALLSRSRKYVEFPPMNGIDRLDNGMNYYKENCVPCCKMCNRLKGKFEVGDLLEKIKEIYLKWFKL